MSTPDESTRPLDGLIREDGYRIPPQRMPSPQLQLERTAAEARAYSAQALSVAQQARAHALEAHRVANKTRTAVRWNLVAVIANTLVCAFLVAVALGWL